VTIYVYLLYASGQSPLHYLIYNDLLFFVKYIQTFPYRNIVGSNFFPVQKVLLNPNL